jgi:DNA polymerase-3 subunit alpha
MQTKFTHLHVHTHYSLLDGLSKIDELLEYVKESGMDSVAITDHGNLYGAVEFYQKAQKYGIKPIIGLEGYIATGDMRDKQPNIDDKRWHITLLAENQTGYKNLIKLITEAHLHGFYYKPRFDKALLRKYSEGIIALSGCLAAEIPRLIQAKKIDQAKKTIAEYKDVFGENNFFLEMQSHPNLKDQREVNEALYRLGKETSTPVVATQDSHYTRSEDAEAHDVLLAIQTGNKVDDDNRLTFKDDDFSVKSPKQMAAEFADYPEAIENTQKIAQRCNVEIEFNKIQLPNYEVPENFTAKTYLKKLCQDGLKNRYGENPSEEILKRLEYELSVINNTGFASYMLIVQDFVSWAKSQNIVVGPGRGSAAGSIVSYLLNITKIDPIEFGLIFERFLNPERASMPDIDLDFADTRRDEVLRYVSDKYGKDKVAQIITFGTMAARAAVRDVGRALGYPYGYCDKIARLIPMFYSLEKAMDEIGELKQVYEQDARAKKLLDMARKLEGVARHASVHACGVVITQQPLVDIVPLQHAPQSEQGTLTQFEMHAIEDLGLLKMDFLGLKNLSIIQNTLEEIKRRTGEAIDIDNIALDEQKVYELLQRGETTAIFQLESSGMRRYLKELKPTEFEDIIAMISLYRPGPMELIPDFIARKHGKQKISYIHPKLKPILKNTYGIAVYQEQVLQIARDLGGFTYGEADVLRKAIGKKIKKLLDEQQEKWMNGLTKNGVDQKTATRLWEFVKPFASYGFNRSHAACYARIAYETAYLKALYPLEFMTALLNAEQKNIDRMAFIIEEAKNMDIKILPPSINESEYGFTVISDMAIRFGLAAIKNVGANFVREIIEERNRNGKFNSLENLAERMNSKDFNKKSLESLIKAGALDELNQRNALLENIDNILQYARRCREIKNSGQENLFGNMKTAVSKLSLKQVEPVPQAQALAWEKELLGFYVSGHPLSDHRNTLKNLGTIKTLIAQGKELAPAKVGAVINNVKKIITKNGQPMMFLELEDSTGKIEAVIFPSLTEIKGDIIAENKAVIVDGKVSARSNGIKLICENITELV